MPDQTDIDDPAWMVTCQDCGKPFRRRSLHGPKPMRCDDCKLIKKQADIDKLRRDQLQEPHYNQEAAQEPNTGITQPVDDVPVVAKVEPSWLDDEEAQGMLVERRKHELGLDEDERQAEMAAAIDADVEEEKATYTLDDAEIRELEEAVARAREARAEPSQVEAPAKPQRATNTEAAEVCIVPPCMTPDPPHVGLFCTPHWTHISLETRGVLLGAPRGSAPFDHEVQRALRQLAE